MTDTPVVKWSILILLIAVVTGTGQLALARVATTTTLTASPNPAVVGQTVTFTVTVTATGGVPVTAPVQIDIGQAFLRLSPLVNGVSTTTYVAPGPPNTLQFTAIYQGDANTLPSASTPLNLVVAAAPGLATTSVALASSANPAFVGQIVVYTATVTGNGANPPTGTVTFNYPSTNDHRTVPLTNGTATTTNSFAVGTFPVQANYSGDANNLGSASATLGQVVQIAGVSPPLQFVPVTPCRVADTRGPAGAFGGPTLAGGQTRSFAVPQSACGIPATAVAYSMNVTAIPTAPLPYLAVWPTGQMQPQVSLLNSLDGRIKADATIIPAGTSGAVSVYALQAATDVILDINGYFAPPAAGSLSFYPLTPCRAVDTRNAPGPLGGPYLAGGVGRSFPLQTSSCQIPATAQALSLNVTAIPAGPLSFLTVWPTGSAQPNVSTLNALTGTITANAAIVPVSSGGAVSVIATSNIDLLIDVNGYFAPPGPGGLSLYTVTPCRVSDSRLQPYSPYPGTFTINVQQSYCAIPAAATEYVLNATVVPPGALNFLTLWGSGATQPLVSTLNALDGTITSNMAIVPTTNGAIDTYASDPTQLILDISSYFAP